MTDIREDPSQAEFHHITPFSEWDPTDINKLGGATMDWQNWRIAVMY